LYEGEFDGGDRDSDMMKKKFLLNGGDGFKRESIGRTWG
jgi:hypothetical protein